jgi:hypothetical protein
MTKELRKYRRFHTDIDITMQDRSQAKGKMVDVSREGCLIILPKGLKPINSFITLKAYLGKKDLEGVKIVGKVVHHTKYQNQDAMGIELLELAVEDLHRWLNFLGSSQQEQDAMPLKVLKTQDESVKVTPYPSFTLRFKNLEKLRAFFPDDIRDPIFVNTPIEKKIGETLELTIVHPEQEKILQILVTVSKRGQHPVRTHKTGLFCLLDDPSDKTKEEIDAFLNATP